MSKLDKLRKKVVDLKETFMDKASDKLESIAEKYEEDPASFWYPLVVVGYVGGVLVGFNLGYPTGRQSVVNEIANKIVQDRLN